METLYFHAECTHCSYTSERYDNETQGGVSTATDKAKEHLKVCGHPVNVLRDNELHSIVQKWRPR